MNDQKHRSGTEIGPEFAFSSERDAAMRLRAAARAAGVALHPLPYSRFDPDNTTWWLSPETTNPAYASGKIVIEHPTIVDDGAKLIGLHVEKGVGSSAAAVFDETPRGRRLVMGDDWLWHRFQRGLRSGELDQAVREAETAAGDLPLVVEVVAALQWPPKLDDVDDRPVDPDAIERCRYRSSRGHLTLVARRTARRLGDFGEDETMKALGEKVSAIPDLDWTWVEILVGVPFRPVRRGGLRAVEVWERVCAPWIQWVR